MKRIPTALVLAAILIGIALMGNFLIDRTTDRMLTQLQSIQKDCEGGSFETAQDSIKALQEYYQHKEHWLALFIKRDYLGQFSVTVSGLSSYTHPDNAQDLGCEVQQAQEQLLVLRHLFFGII